MLIDQLMITPPHLPNGLVPLIKEGNMPMSMPIPSIMITFKAKQYILSLPSPDLEISGPDTVDTVAGPDQIAIVAEDIRACLAGLVLLGGGIGVAGEWGDKEVARFYLGSCWYRDVQAWRRKVWSGSVLPISDRRSYRREESNE